MGHTGVKTMDELVKSGRALKMGSTTAGSTYNDISPKTKQGLQFLVRKEKSS